ncbi:MAG TPA: enoyl-CoA hydratase-related protein [Micromonosporaceae bacterium]
MSFETLQVRVEPGVLRVTLDRPGKQNSINGAMLNELNAVLDQAEASPTCRMVVLEGGDGVFCTGMDFADATRDDHATDDLARRGGEEFFGLLDRLTTMPRVVVANVDGRVAGGGVGLVAASDLAVATPRSTFGLPEALWGLLPCCVLPFLIRRVGFQPAHAMTLTTLPVSADRALATGLVDEVVEDFTPVLRRLRARLTKLDTATIGDAKHYLRRMWFLSAETEQTAVTEFSRLMSSPVVRQRLGAFAQRQAFPWDSPAGTGARP